MRLIGTLENEKQAFLFYSFLLREGIKSSYEAVVNSETRKREMRIWVFEEDDVDKAISWLDQYKKNPNDPTFTEIEPTFTSPPPIHAISSHQEEAKTVQKNKWQVKISLKPKSGFSFPLTYLIIIACGFIFLWNGMEKLQMVKQFGLISLEIGLTPLQQKLMFDYPKSSQKIDQLIKEYPPLKSVDEIKKLPEEERRQFEEAQSIPTWKGLMNFFFGKNKKTLEEAPLFEKIREGEYWRLFTPCLLHAGFLHILFNMAWVWILCKQLESRLKKWKILILIIVIGVVSNISQYLMSGPFFLGFSGVVVGMVGFIWVRQKTAPWEGYSIQKITFVFILVFILAMFALEVFSLLLQIFTLSEISANIANTAHIVGGLVGMALAKIPFFARE
ncbi:MAG: rhomboid family intramembrane serine protease [Chlamydiae bacterium]|nr:rhomboid family intramembrane serine protease [Chlamydiota bacterium]